MKQKVKELCKEQSITLKELAEKIGIARESLTRALNGNPTLSTINGIADALGIPVWQLFVSSDDLVTGHVEYKGTTYRIRTRQDLEELLKKMN